MSEEQDNRKLIPYLEELGWSFVPTGPEEWTWLLFDEDGLVSAQQGDRVWSHDVKEAKEKVRMEK